MRITWRIDATDLGRVRAFFGKHSELVPRSKSWTSVSAMSGCMFSLIRVYERIGSEHSHRLEPLTMGITIASDVSCE